MLPVRHIGALARIQHHEAAASRDQRSVTVEEVTEQAKPVLWRARAWENANSNRDLGANLNHAAGRDLEKVARIARRLGKCNE